MREQSLGARSLALLMLVASALSAGLAGCKTAVSWELGTFEDAFQKSLKLKKPTFVYFRSWYSVDCTNFEDNVLSHPRILAALKSFVSVPLEFDWDKGLADRWGITRTPGTAIIDNHRQVLAKTNGVVSVQQLLDTLNGALEKIPPQSSPTSTGPASAPISAPPAAAPPAQPVPATQPPPAPAGQPGEMTTVR